MLFVRAVGCVCALLVVLSAAPTEALAGGRFARGPRTRAASVGAHTSKPSAPASRRAIGSPAKNLFLRGAVRPGKSAVKSGPLARSRAKAKAKAVAKAKVKAGRIQRVKAAGRAVKRAAHTTVKVTRAFGRGMAVDGPRHTWASIKRQPALFAAGLAFIGGVGAVASLAGISGEGAALALSFGALAAQFKAALPGFKQARGAHEVARRLGADFAWPTFLFAATVVGGHSLSDGGAHAAAGAKPSVGSLGNVFASSAVIGGDAPTIAVTALDTAKRAAQRRASQNQAAPAPAN